jgi:hypothetical protein
MNTLTKRILALAGAALVVAGTFIPYAHVGGYSSYGIVDFDSFRYTWMNLLVPFAAAIVTALAATLLLHRLPRIAGAVLTVLGGQTFLFFLTYVFYTITTNGSSFRPGALIGALGGALITAVGVITFLSPETVTHPAVAMQSPSGQHPAAPPPAAAPQPIASPPAGWYTDPGSLEALRFWNGQAWTTEVRPLTPSEAGA